MERDRRFERQVSDGLDLYERTYGPVPGLDPGRRESLVGQIVESMRRDVYYYLLLTRDLSPKSTDPSDELRFDPLKAAILHHRAGDVEEAFWLTFLSTHFGKNRRGGWNSARRVYGALASGDPWTWKKVTTDVTGFRDWLDEHHKDLAARPGGFGNHRKREHLGGWAANGTGVAVVTYIAWAGEPPSQADRFAEAAEAAGGDPSAAFAIMNASLGSVQRFGRLARFDYLNTVRRLGFADITAGHAYFKGSSGPLAGARLLFGPSSAKPAVKGYETQAAELAECLGVGFDVIEDSLCNWQKSPDEFTRFRG